MNGSPRLALLAVATALTSAAAGRPAGAQAVGMDTASLGDGPYARMEMLLERTIFRVNVLTLELRLGRETTDRLRRLLEGREATEARADSAARIAARATDALARIEFRRGIGLGRFLDGVRGNMRKAMEAGYLTGEEYGRISSSLPRWFAFLEERKILDRDELLYRIRGDTLRTVFRTRDRRVLLDQTDVGPERRLAVLGGYFAEGSDFREDLIRSLFEKE